MLEICLATALCDPSGQLLARARALWPELTTRFGAVAVHVTRDTHEGWFELLEHHRIPFEISPADADTVGEHRRRALQVALSGAAPSLLLYADPGQLLRWLERSPQDLDRLLRHIPRWDCLVIGRSPAAFAAAPAPRRDTEALVNHVCRLLTGRDWDLGLAARGLSRHAAHLIVERCDERTAGSNVTWPLLCEIHGLSLSYAEADEAAAGELDDFDHGGGGEQHALDDAPRAWMRRMQLAGQHLDALRPFLDYYQSALTPGDRLTMSAAGGG